MSRSKQRSAFDQVSEFDRGRIVACRDCGLSFRKIGSRVGRNHTTVMRICDRWQQDGTTDQRGRSHPHQCTIHVRTVSARTIRRRLQQSGLCARRPLLGLSLKQNHRRLCRQWCDERRMWVAEWKAVVFTDESRICLQHYDGRIRVRRHFGERMLNQLRYAPPHWSYIGQRYISEVLESVVLPHLQGLTTAIFQQDNARPHVPHIVQRFFVNHQIEWLLWLTHFSDLSPIENVWSMVDLQLTQITPPSATPDQLWQRVEAAWSIVPQEHFQTLFESMPRRVAAVITNNGG
ncbi:transposable element Tcb1 transposase [Trichonephila clavipes]|nr:transposable element Tcb1 transposase [Trichonephila clavipes]